MGEIDVLPYKDGRRKVPRWNPAAYSEDKKKEPIKHVVTLPDFDTSYIKVSTTRPGDVADRYSKIVNYSWDIHPIYKLPRIIVSLERLFILGMDGDIEAIKLFLDRTLGKQMDGLAVFTNPTGQLSDKELLDNMSKLIASNRIIGEEVEKEANEVVKGGDKPKDE